jgi:hypothetical protein
MGKRLASATHVARACPPLDALPMAGRPARTPFRHPHVYTHDPVPFFLDSRTTRSDPRTGSADHTQATRKISQESQRPHVRIPGRGHVTRRAQYKTDAGGPLGARREEEGSACVQ